MRDGGSQLAVVGDAGRRGVDVAVAAGGARPAHGRNARQPGRTGRPRDDARVPRPARRTRRVRPRRTLLC